jgi:hypothetical protein
MLCPQMKVHTHTHTSCWIEDGDGLVNNENISNILHLKRKLLTKIMFLLWYVLCHHIMVVLQSGGECTSRNQEMSHHHKVSPHPFWIQGYCWLEAQCSMKHNIEIDDEFCVSMDCECLINDFLQCRTYGN